MNTIVARADEWEEICEKGKVRPNYSRHGRPLSGCWLSLEVKWRATARFSAEKCNDLTYIL